MVNEQVIPETAVPPAGDFTAGRIRLNDDVARVLKSREGAGYLEMVMLLLAGMMLLIVATMPWG